MLRRPTGMFDREREWRELSEFATGGGPENRLALVLGRRRQGKSMLVRALADATGGFVFEAAQQSSAQNLAEFSEAWARHTGAVGLSFRSWNQVVDHLGALPPTETPRVVVFDEVGYLIDSTPEFPSILQRLFTERPAGALRVLLCGSAFAQMRQLLAPTAALRGRQHRVVQVDPFDYRTAASFWGLDANPDAAFRLHALVGGTPAYRRFTVDGPLTDGNVDAFVVDHLLQPSSALFGEGRAVVAEDPTLEDKSLYWAALNAITDGARRRGDIATALGRPDSALHVPIEALTAAALIEKRPDPFNRRAVTLLTTEPLLRTERVLIAPERARLDRGRAAAVWEDAQPRVARQILGPHLEWMAAEWILSSASAATVGGEVRTAGPATLVRAKQRHQLDVVAVAPDRDDVERICAIGECKASGAPIGVDQLVHLDELVDSIGPRCRPDAKRFLFARSGFTAELRRAARARGDVELVDVDRLYHGS